MSDEARRRILDRRARFVAAALASTSVGCDRINPLVCLEPTPIAADDATAKPSTTATATATVSASASAPSPDAEAMPMECLKIAAPPSTPPPKPSSGGGGGGAKPKMCLTELFHDEEPEPG